MSTWQQPNDPTVAKSAWLDDLTPWVVTDGPGAAPGPAGGFAMSRSEMRQVLAEARQLQEQVDAQAAAVQPLHSVIPPAQDPASQRYTTVANMTGMNYRNHLKLQSKYLGELITKLTKTLGGVEESDAAADAAVRGAAG